MAVMGLSMSVADDGRELVYKKAIGAWAAYRRRVGPKGSLLASVDGIGGEEIRDANLISPVSVRAIAVWDIDGA